MSGHGAASALHARGVWMKRQIESKLDRRGLAYAWWIPLVSLGSLVAATIAALAQRDALLPPRPVTLALPLALAPILQFYVPPRFGAWIDAPAVMAASILLLSHPLHAEGPADMAPSLLMIVTAVLAARDGVKAGVLTSIASLGILAWAAAYVGLPSPVMFGMEVVLGLDVGCMLRWQMRALAAEKAARAGASRQATLAERQRIAREIHDLVAHSLSVTLLHITGARQALRDGDGVGEADEALEDAERVGRQAMADIRRTVSTLADGPSTSRPLPAGHDIRALIEQVRAAGLAVEYAERGDVTASGEAVGLGLYRITQESLANVVKHAPGAPANVSLDVDARDGIRLRITNPVAGARSRSDGDGHGVAGMQARAEQLGARLEAGPRGREWVVDVLIPAASKAFECPLPALAKKAMP